jgi:sugar lactone lactonase YvrE
LQRYRSTPIAEGLYVPEGLRWTGSEVHFGDILAAHVGSVAPDGSIRTVGQFDGPCSGIGYLADGSMLVSLMRHRRLERISADGSVSTHADLASLGYDYINDMVTDAAGRAYLDGLRTHLHWFDPEPGPDGTIIHRYRNDQGPAGSSPIDDLLLVEPDGSVSVAARDLAGPNGLALSADGRTLIVAEWRASRLTSFPVNADGSLGPREHFADTPGGPDGICLDVEGAVWVSLPATGRCVRVARGGAVLAEVVVTGKRATSCVLAGPGRRTLYISTDEMPTPNRGRIEVVDVPVPGTGAP